MNYLTPLQIRRKANGPWPGDVQRVALRGTTYGEHFAKMADKAEADARKADARPGTLGFRGPWLDIDPLDAVDLPGTPEVDLFDPDADRDVFCEGTDFCACAPCEEYWGPADPRDFEPVE